MKAECRSKLYFATILSVLLAAIFAISGCTNPEKAKIAHVEKGEAYLKDEKYQEASIEFRNAIQIDERLAYPKRVESNLSLARFYIIINDKAKAEETSQPAIWVNSNSGLAHTEYGKVSRASGLLTIQTSEDAAYSLRCRC